jgi:hypothetical protein
MCFLDVPFPGCDFFFEQSTTTNFHVALRFKKLKGDASTVAKAQNGGLENRATAPTIDSITPQSEFRFNGAMYNVKSVEGDIVKCKLSHHEDSDDSDCEEFTFPVEQITDLVKEYNKADV